MTTDFFADIKLPKKINPCPILEAIIELRFDSPFPPDAIFGIIYKEFKSEYPVAQELPILQLPEAIRSKDQSLRHKPFYRIPSEDGRYLLQIGPRVMSLISKSPYTGWSHFSSKINDLVKKVSKLEIIGGYTRVGVRYLNGFDCDVLEKINLSLHMREKLVSNLDISLKLDIPHEGYESTLRVINNAKIKKDKTLAQGSVIDIDTSINNPKDKIASIIENGHLVEKKLFFSLLQKDFIENELNPEY